MGAAGGGLWAVERVSELGLGREEGGVSRDVV